MTPAVPYLIVITWAVNSYSNAFYMFALYLALVGFPSEKTGILIGAFYAAATLVRPLGGWVTERFGIRRALVVSAALCAAAALFKFSTVSFIPLLFIRLTMGCFYGIFIVALTTYQTLVIPENIRGKAFVIISIGSLSCLFTVVPLAEWFLKHGWASLFLAIPVCVSALCVILSLRLPPAGIGNVPASGWGTWGELYRDTPFWRIVTSCALFGLCDASIVYLPALVIALKLVPSSFVIANGLGALTMRVLGRNFFNRHPRYLFAGPSLFVMSVSLYLTAAAASDIWLFACGLFYGAGMGFGYPAHLALTGDLAPVRLRAKSSSLVYFCYDISWFILPVYVGFVTPYIGEMGSFKYLASFCAVSGAGLTLMWRRYSRAAV